MSADDCAPTHQKKLSRSLFKKKSWGKKSKDDDSNNASPISPSDPSSAAAAANNFNLNQDVVDFLKPSTEKNVPKLDIALARRWPESQDVRRIPVDSEPLPPAPANMYTKPKRRKGLTVAFVKTVPEIIGEGGDEAPDPPWEISRNKAKMSRSASDRRPSSASDSLGQSRAPPMPGLQPTPPLQGQQYARPQSSGRGLSPSQPPRMQDMGASPPMRRTYTSGNEFSPAMQRRMAPDNGEGTIPHRPSHARTPTGFSSPALGPTEPGPEGESAPPLPPSLPAIDTQFGEKRQVQDAELGLPPEINYPGLEPALADPASPVAVKKREMRASEGQALRRASMMFPDDLAEDEDDSTSGHTGPRTSHVSPLPSPDAASDMHPGFERAAPGDYIPSPDSVSTMDSPGPFADPKYTIQHPGERASASRAFAHRPHPSVGRTVAPPPVPQDGPPTSEPRTRSLHSYSNSHAAQQQDRHVGPQTGGASRVSAPPRPAPNYSNVYTSPASLRLSSEFHEENYLPRPTQSQASPSVSRQSSQQSGYATYQPAGSARSSHHAHAQDPSLPSDWQPPIFPRSNGSSTSVDRLVPARSAHSRSASRERDDLHLPPDIPGQPAISPYRISNAPSLGHGLSSKISQASLLGPGVRGSATPTSRPAYGEARQSYQNARSPIVALRETERPSSATSHTSSILRAPASPSRGGYESDTASEAAYADFAGRVAHMKGVFRLTAEREIPADQCSPAMWLRAALWWYLQGKMGLEDLLRQHDRRGLLTQAHVDLGKAWWILVDRLEVHATLGEQGLDEGVTALRYHLKSLSLAMAKNSIFPPEQSLIQGQDTRLWLEYPRFTMDAAAVLGGSTSTSMIVVDQKHVNPYDLLPLDDSREAFCYGRFPVEVSINADEQDTDRVVLACMLTVSRDRRDYQTSLSIASQNELVSIRVLPELQGKRTLTWSDVAFQSTSSSIRIRLPRGFDLTIRMQERDFRAVWNLTSYALKVSRSLRPAEDERLIHEVRLTELQYADSANAHGFPSEKLKGCMAMVYEKSTTHTDGNGIRRLHRGYRLLLITEPGHKTLSAVSHEVGRKGPVLFEYLTDASAGGTVAMVLRIREEQRQCRILLVFPDAAIRQDFHAALTGAKLADDETIVAKTALSSLLIESADPAHFSATPSPLQSLKWTCLSVTNRLPDPGSPNHPSRRGSSSTVESDHLRLVAHHATGTFTDRLNLAKGELLLRFPAPSPATPRDTIQILRAGQQDATMAVDVRSTPVHVVGEVSKVQQMMTHGATLRTWSFPTVGDLHGFVEAVTGYRVVFDGLATRFAVSRRRIVVPIVRKLEAGNVRVLVVSRSGGVGLRSSGAGGGQDTKVLAFMEGFAQCEALCVRVREMDVVERVGKGTRNGYGIRLVDAKFTLVPPGGGGGGEGDGWGGLKGRFVNLEGLEYAEEHDDLTVGFEGEGDCEAFANALPAAVGNGSRGFGLKRRT